MKYVNFNFKINLMDSKSFIVIILSRTERSRDGSLTRRKSYVREVSKRNPSA